VGANQCRGCPRHFSIPTGPRALAIRARSWVAEVPLPVEAALGVCPLAAVSAFPAAVAARSVALAGAKDVVPPVVAVLGLRPLADGGVLPAAAAAKSVVAADGGGRGAGRCPRQVRGCGGSKADALPRAGAVMGLLPRATGRKRVVGCRRRRVGLFGARRGACGPARGGGAELLAAGVWGGPSCRLPTSPRRSHWREGGGCDAARGGGARRAAAAGRGRFVGCRGLQVSRSGGGGEGSGRGGRSVARGGGGRGGRGVAREGGAGIVVADGGGPVAGRWAAKLAAVSGKADVVPCARRVLCFLPPVAAGVLPAAAAVESVLGAQGAAVLPRNTTRTRRSAGWVAVGTSRKVALPACA